MSPTFSRQREPGYKNLILIPQIVGILAFVTCASLHTNKFNCTIGQCFSWVSHESSHKIKAVFMCTVVSKVLVLNFYS